MSVSCSSGVFDCDAEDFDPLTDVCTDYNDEFKDMEGVVWLPVIGGFVMCAMAFTIGGNDVANAWGTSVGSGAVSLRLATIIAGVSNWLGAVTLGSGVSEEILQGVSDIDDEDCWACGYCDSKMSVFFVGMFSALIAASVFLMIATHTKMPVSTTHAIVGGVVGITIAAVGGSCLDWALDKGLGGIVLSWVTSPILAGLIGALAYVTTNKYVINSKNPRRNALVAVPILYGLSGFVMFFLILAKYPTTGSQPIWILILASLAGMILVMLATYVYIVPKVEAGMPSTAVEGYTGLPDPRTPWGKFVHWLMGPTQTSESNDSTPLATQLELAVTEKAIGDKDSKEDVDEDGKIVGHTPEVPDETENFTAEQKDAIYAFRYLLVFNACLESFAHGANDTANSTAAFAAIIGGYESGLQDCEGQSTPRWVMAIAGFFVLLGVYTVGYRVIETVGKNITIVNYQRGWCMEFASTLSVVVATWFNFPVSTTHCQIGAVTFVGLVAFGPKKVSWGLLGQIAVSWVLTLPFAGLLAAALMAIFREAIRN